MAQVVLHLSVADYGAMQDMGDQERLDWLMAIKPGGLPPLGNELSVYCGWSFLCGDETLWVVRLPDGYDLVKPRVPIR